MVRETSAYINGSKTAQRPGKPDTRPRTSLSTLYEIPPRKLFPIKPANTWRVSTPNHPLPSTAPPNVAAPGVGFFVYACYATAIGVGGVNWSGLSGVSVNICKTFGVCVAICLLPLGGCSPKTELERTVEKANGGDPMAQYNLGVMYDNGQGVLQDDAVAVKWYRLAAEQGNAFAQYNLGVMYANGKGVPQDDAEAVKWYRLAAEQEYALAQFNLGVRCANGKGVPQDDAEAVKWYRLAAEQGKAFAQYNLGVKYANGEGVPQDDVEAYAWFSVAATGGSIHAEKKRDVAKEQLTAEQLAEAQKRATESFENYGSGM